MTQLDAGTVLTSNLKKVAMAMTGKIPEKIKCFENILFLRGNFSDFSVQNQELL